MMVGCWCQLCMRAALCTQQVRQCVDDLMMLCRHVSCAAIRHQQRLVGPCYQCTHVYCLCSHSSDSCCCSCLPDVTLSAVERLQQCCSLSTARLLTLHPACSRAAMRRVAALTWPAVCAAFGGSRHSIQSSSMRQGPSAVYSSPAGKMPAVHVPHERGVLCHVVLDVLGTSHGADMACRLWSAWPPRASTSQTPLPCTRGTKRTTATMMVRSDSWQITACCRNHALVQSVHTGLSSVQGCSLCP